MSSPLFPLREGQVPGQHMTPGTGANSQSSGEPPSSAGDWKREMERAQLDSWFKPLQAAPGNASRRAGAAGQAAPDAGGAQLAPAKNGLKAGARAPVPELPASPAANRAPVVRAPAPAAVYTLKFETAPMGVADIRLGGLALALAGISRPKVTASRPNPADIADPAQALDGADAPTAGLEEPGPHERAIRLHAEWHGQDVTVWLGIDARAGAPEEQLAQLLPHIRACLQEQRSRLVKLVCNGKTEFEVSSPVLPAFAYFTQSKESS